MSPSDTAGVAVVVAVAVHLTCLWPASVCHTDDDSQAVAMLHSLSRKQQLQRKRLRSCS